MKNICNTTLLKRIFSIIATVAILFLVAAQQPVANQSTSQAAPAPSDAGALSANLASLSHIITPGDVVEMKVYQEDELSTRSRVDLDGSINLPLLGSIKIAGKSIGDAANQIKQLLEIDYLWNPRVALSVTDFAKRRFSVLGQVSKPGSYEIPASENVSLLQAIATAGGYTRIADPSKITVKRIVNGKETIIRLNAKMMANDKNSKNFEIQSDDTISVSESIF